MDIARTFTPDQLKLIEANRDFNVAEGVDWWDCTYDDFISVAAAFGIDTGHDTISFSGFWSQGDGASFLFSSVSAQEIIDAGIKFNAEKPFGDGPYESYVAEFLSLWQMLFDTFATYSMTSPEGHRVASNYHIRAERTGRSYVHSGMVTAYVEHNYDQEDIELFPDLAKRLDGFDAQIDKQVERIADALYRALESEYEFQTSDEQVWDSLEANGIKPEEDDDSSD